MRSAWLGRATTALIAAVAMIPSDPPPAAADDHEPPRAVLWSGGLGQRGLLYDFNWTSCGGFDCHGAACAGCRPRFPERALRLGAGRHRARVVLHKSARPRDPRLRYWDAIDADGHPVGRATRLRFRLRHPGERRWVARFRLPAVAPDAYLAFQARWPDVDIQARQVAAWGFHVAP